MGTNGDFTLAGAHNVTRNKLLASLPWLESEPSLRQLKRVDLPLGKILCEYGSKPTHVYFPTTSIVSLLSVMENGASAEIAVVGNESIVGVSLFMGGESTPSRAVVESAGEGLRLKAHELMREFTVPAPCFTYCCAIPKHS